MNRLNLLPENPDTTSPGRFPAWLHRPLPRGNQLPQTSALLSQYNLNTVCEEAKCPNRFECYTKKTATFLALGRECTRNCGFCDIDFSRTPKAPETDEPLRIALSVRDLHLRHAVVTMVARDDLPDQGAAHIAAIIHAIRAHNPTTTVEVLTSDFSGDTAALDTVLAAQPEVFNHNIETVRRLTPRVRNRATYDRTLAVLAHAARQRPRFVKSGLMLGLGETASEVHETLQDLHKAGVQIVTIGQYLQASRSKLLVKEFIHPDQFAAYAAYGHSLGLTHVYAGPFIRSSFNAAALFLEPSRLILHPETGSPKPAESTATP